MPSRGSVEASGQKSKLPASCIASSCLRPCALCARENGIAHNSIALSPTYLDYAGVQALQPLLRSARKIMEDKGEEKKKEIHTWEGNVTRDVTLKLRQIHRSYPGYMGRG